MRVRPDTSEELAARSAATSPGLAERILESVSRRADGWVNALMGFGGAADRTSATSYAGAFIPLQWPELTAMFATEDLSAKIVDVYPREALRRGFGVGGLDDADPAEVSRYLQAKLITKRGKYLPLMAAIWGRLYGNAGAWMGSLKADPSTPFQPGEQIDFIRVIDDRYLRPAYLGWEYLDPDGEPILWRVTHPQMPEFRSAVIHESRLVLFPGAPTDDLTRVARGYRDLSVLQKPYNALRSDGTVWKATETLISEASVGVMKIKNLFSLVTSGQRDNLTERLRLANLGRTLNRSMVLDADKEDYTRVQQTFAGIPDLTDRAIKRVASAAEIPVTVLMGEAPAGLNATGDSDLRWFFARIQAYREQVLEPLLTRMVRMLLSQSDSPWKAKAEKATIVWPALWEPTAAERADIMQKTAQADQLYLDMGVLTVEEIRNGRFTDDGFQAELHLDHEIDETELAEESPDEMKVAGPQVLAAVVAQAVSGEIPKTAALAILTLAVGEDVAADMLADVSDEPPAPELVSPPPGDGSLPPGQQPPPPPGSPPAGPGAPAPAREPSAPKGDE